MEKLGKCPKCGADYLEGTYGPYCSGKCGFRLGKTVFGHELTKKEKKDLLNKKKILLKGLVSKRTGNTYDMYITPTGIREFSYKNKAGKRVTGFEYSYNTEFPTSYEKEDKKESSPAPDTETAADPEADSSMKSDRCRNDDPSNMPF